jgi:hypothetical protein
MDPACMQLLENAFVVLVPHQLIVWGGGRQPGRGDLVEEQFSSSNAISQCKEDLEG